MGQLRSSGHVEGNFDSDARDVAIVAMTPRGANMAYRRSALAPLFGTQWFDPGLTGSAHREESTLALKLFRAGHYVVFAPQASLLHLESTEGGCENRLQLTPERRLSTYELEHLFLHRLFAPLGTVGGWAPLLRLIPEVQLCSPSGAEKPTPHERLETTRLGLTAFLRAKQRFRVRGR